MQQAIVIPEDELPDWIHRARQDLDRGLFFVVLLSLAVAWTFIIYDGLPRHNATTAYLFQTADIVEALSEGRLFPRWSPHALGGYGAPVAYFYPPGAPWTAALIESLFTSDTILAVRILFTASLVMAGVMVYVLMLQYRNAAVGILAATLYITSPWAGMIAPHITGSLPDVMALGLLPGLLWATTRLLYRHHPIDLLTVSLFTAALTLTAPHILPVALLLLSMQTTGYLRYNRNWNRLWILAGAFLIGLLMTAFYWFPALIDAIDIPWISAGISPLDLRLTITEIFQAARQIDPGAMLPAPPLTPGLPLILFALFSIATLIYQRSWQTIEVGFLVCGGLLLLLGLIIMPESIWLLGPISLCLAVGGSAVLNLRESLKTVPARLLLASSLTLIMIMAIPVWIGPEPPVTSGAITPAEQLRFEQQGFGVAVLPPGAPLPSYLIPPAGNQTLINSYLNNNINRFSDDPALQNRASVLLEETHRHQFQILRLRDESTLTLQLAYFPGWQATLDNRPLPVNRHPASGQIQLQLPATDSSNLTISFQSTSLRDAAGLLSLGALIGLGFLTVRRYRNLPPPPFQRLKVLTPAESRLIVMVLISFIIGAAAILSPLTPVALRAEGAYALRGSVSLRYRTDVGLEAFAYQLSRTNFTPGETIDLSLHWQAARFLRENYRVRISLRDVRDGTTQISLPDRHPGNYPTRRWLRNRYVTDHYRIPLPDTIQPGRYVLVAEVLLCDPVCLDSTRLSFFDSDGITTGTALTLPQIISISDS